MQGQSYLIQRVVLYLFLTIFAIWGVNYLAQSVGEYLESRLMKATELETVGL